MRCPRAGEVGGLTPPADWERARRAYRTLVEGHDPAAELSTVATHDLRPGGRAPTDGSGPVIVSGPEDLWELRDLVERALGFDTWPSSSHVEGRPLTAVMPLTRASPVLALLLAMDGLVESRSPWRTWRNVVESLAPAVEGLDQLTLDARVIER